MDFQIIFWVALVLVATNTRGEGHDIEDNPDLPLSRNVRDTTSNLSKAVEETPNVEKDGDQYVLRITTLLNPPYVIYKDGKYSGFLPDLIEEMFARADPHRNVNYSFYQPNDGRFGMLKDDGSWTGMMGEVIKNTNGSSKDGAHLAAASLTITSTRVQYVDFLQPFAHNTLSFVIQKPHRANKAANASYDDQDDIFKFNFDIFKPLAPSVWILVTVLFVVVWLFTWLMNHFNPYEFGERYKRNLATEDEAQFFNITGALWYTFTILQWQGYDRAPRSMASKVIGCFWMVFVTVTLVTYMGSLFNMLFWASNMHGNQDPLIPPVRDLRDLINHKDGYTYGWLKGGSTQRYIENVARGEEVDVMRKYMKSDDGVKNLVSSSEDGLKKVRNEKYAFLMESPAAEYHVSRHPCDLMMTGINMGMSSFGLALPKNAPYGPELHKMLLEMIEVGEVEQIKERWFNDRQCWNVISMEKALSKHNSQLYLNKALPVNISMFWSPLVIMVLGIVLSSLVAIAEILWYKYRGRYDAKNRNRGHQLTNEDDGHI